MRVQVPSATLEAVGREGGRAVGQQPRSPSILADLDTERSDIPPYRPTVLPPRSVAQLVEHRSPKPGVAGSIPAGPVNGRGGTSRTAGPTALSSRGLGRGPLKAQTRVRIPLALWMEGRDGRAGRVDGPIVYRFRTRPFQGRKTGSIPVGAIVRASAPLAQLAEQGTLNP